VLHIACGYQVSGARWHGIAVKFWNKPSGKNGRSSQPDYVLHETLALVQRRLGWDAVEALIRPPLGSVHDLLWYFCVTFWPSGGCEGWTCSAASILSALSCFGFFMVSPCLLHALSMLLHRSMDQGWNELSVGMALVNRSQCSSVRSERNLGPMVRVCPKANDSASQRERVDTAAEACDVLPNAGFQRKTKKQEIM
jgi:hypothetical protein